LSRLAPSNIEGYPRPAIVFTAVIQVLEEGEVTNTPLDKERLVVCTLLRCGYNQDLFVDVVIQPPHHISSRDPAFANTPKTTKLRTKRAMLQVVGHP
jgi:hypothetical protein